MIGLIPYIRDLNNCSLYKVQREGICEQILEFVLTTPHTRAICNDPFVLGTKYTHHMRIAATSAFKALLQTGVFKGDEKSTHVLTILRGGLNFELREALSDAFQWSAHGAWFISAQRRLIEDSKGEWEIVEDSYCKMYPADLVDVVFGDVVATGTSLRHGLQKLREQLSVAKRCRSVTFFTIGSPISGEILADWRSSVEEALGYSVECSIIYYEGMFAVAEEDTPIRIKIAGTDLLRRNSAMAPEFIESQYENPAFPLERCTIYDAGSRAFSIPEYLEDVSEYWHSVASMAAAGCAFADLIKERAPEIDLERFGKVDLAELANFQLEKCRALLR
jgi:hypothetical protein